MFSNWAQKTHLNLSEFNRLVILNYFIYAKSRSYLLYALCEIVEASVDILTTVFLFLTDIRKNAFAINLFFLKTYSPEKIEESIKNILSKESLLQNFRTITVRF